MQLAIEAKLFHWQINKIESRLPRAGSRYIYMWRSI